jgi:short-subunit dehydrogenase
MNRPRALITGASSGIGEALARALAAKKYDLVLVARRLELLEALAQTLRDAHGVDVECVALDLAADRAGFELAQRFSTTPFDLVINNAGFGDFGPFIDSPRERVHEMVTLNVTTLTDVSRWALAAMVFAATGDCSMWRRWPVSSAR